jgi:uncharacterized protein (AIM24 family)
VLGGESFFMNTFTASGPDAHVVVAPSLPGDIIIWPLTGNTVYLQSGSYLASPETIDIDSKWGGAKLIARWSQMLRGLLSFRLQRFENSAADFLPDETR